MLALTIVRTTFKSMILFTRTFDLLVVINFIVILSRVYPLVPVTELFDNGSTFEPKWRYRRHRDLPDFPFRLPLPIWLNFLAPHLNLVTSEIYLWNLTFLLTAISFAIPSRSSSIFRGQMKICAMDHTEEVHSVSASNWELVD